MVIVEYALLTMLTLLCSMVSYTDIRYGLVKNRHLLVFLVMGLLLDAVFYGLFARDTVLTFLLNAGVTALVSMTLFYSGNFAGGDSKLSVVIGILYPAGFYLTWRESEITLFLGIAFAIFFGYVWLLLSSLIQIISGRTRITGDYVGTFLKNYFKSYLTALLYVIAINLLFILLKFYGVRTPSWMPWFFCILVAFISPRFPVMRKQTILVGILIFTLVLSFYLRVIPLSLNPITYLITAFFILAQLTIRTNIYQEIETGQVEKGMILSTGASMMFQNMKAAGLPGLSSEGLKDRLTEDQAAAIRRWGDSRVGQKQIVVVKKIPFAVFLSLGYLTYFLIWRMMR